MANYFVDGNPWAGSFILEASTDGISWDTMIAKSSNGTFLGREGLVGGGGNLTSGYNSVAFSNTTFNIYKPSGNASIPPDTVTPQSIPALTRTQTTTCTVTLSRTASGIWDKSKNIKEDFSVHCFPSTDTYPYWSTGTKFNCIVTGYDSGTGLLTFNVTPTFSGSCKFAIIIRSEEGTGKITSDNLVTLETFNIITPIFTVTGNTTSMGISTRVFNNAAYTCIRHTGIITVPSNMLCEILLIAGGGGGGGDSGGAGAGGVVHITGAQLNSGSYSVTIGNGANSVLSDGGDGLVGGNTVAFGLTVYGGGGGGHISGGTEGGSGGGAGYNSNISGSAAKTHTGTLASGVSGTATSYGNAGGDHPAGITGSYFMAGGGGSGGRGGNRAFNQSGAGGQGSSMWSDWCAGCGIGEMDSSGIFRIAGGGGGTGSEVSNQVRAGSATGGGGRGGTAGGATSANKFLGTSQHGIDYSGGGGGGGSSVFYSSKTMISGKGGSGVIIIKQEGAPATIPTPYAPNSTAGWGLQLWLDGSDPNNDGSQPSNDATVSMWIDKSGNSRNAFAYVSGNNAKFRKGQNEGLPSSRGALYFCNTPYRIQMPFSPTTYTIISVFRADGPVNNLSNDDVTQALYVLSGTADYQLWFGVENSCFTTRAGTGIGWQTALSPLISAYRQWAIMTMQYNNSDKTINVWVNGMKFNTITNSSAQNGGSAWNDLYIGQNATNTSQAYKLKGCIAEILIYNTVLSSTDRKSVEAWLSQKYSVGVSL